MRRSNQYFKNHAKFLGLETVFCPGLLKGVRAYSPIAWMSSVRAGTPLLSEIDDVICDASQFIPALVGVPCIFELGPLEVENQRRVTRFLMSSAL